MASGHCTTVTFPPGKLQSRCMVRGTEEIAAKQSGKTAASLPAISSVPFGLLKPTPLCLDGGALFSPHN
jgi:hypothetical protein